MHVSDLSSVSLFLLLHFWARLYFNPLFLKIHSPAATVSLKTTSFKPECVIWP